MGKIDSGGIERALVAFHQIRENPAETLCIYVPLVGMPRAWRFVAEPTDSGCLGGGPSRVFLHLCSLFLASTCQAASGAIRSEVTLGNAKKREQSVTLINTQLPSDGYIEPPQIINDEAAKGGSYEQNLVVKGNPVFTIQEIDDGGEDNTFTQNGVVSEDSYLDQYANATANDSTMKQNGAALNESYLAQSAYTFADDSSLSQTGLTTDEGLLSQYIDNEGKYSNLSQKGAVSKSYANGLQTIFNNGDHTTADQKLDIKKSTDSYIGQFVSVLEYEVLFRFGFLFLILPSMH